MCLTEYDEEATNRAFREDGYLDGVEDGKQEKAVEDARNMLIENISLEIVSKCTGLPIETVQQLAEELTTAKA